MSPPVSTRSAIVLGAGLQGVCSALALRREGFDVLLLDQASEPMTRASRHNEGKIHLGFVYAKDSTDRTARLMLHAALRFAPTMEKLLDLPVSWSELKGRPFTYVIPNDSMLTPAEILHAYDRLQEGYTEAIRDPSLNYLGERPERLFTPRADRTLGGLLNPDRVLAALDTVEVPLDVERFRLKVAGVLRETPGIRRLLGRRVRTIERAGGGFRLTGEGPGAAAWKLRSDLVVNCLWDRRLQFDEQLGLLPRRPWVYRLKLRLFGELPAHLSSLPSITMVLGPYGDIVVNPPAPAYLSWYPACLRGWSEAVSPPDEWERAATGRLDPAEAGDISRAIAQGFEGIIPGIDGTRPLDLAGGVIFSWGESDIDDPASELHRRDEIGVDSHDGYYTINTGKFTCAPLFAEDLVRRIQGAPSCI